jgi:hypothetical protein
LASCPFWSLSSWAEGGRKNGFGFGHKVELVLAWNRRMSGENKAEGEADELVVRQIRPESKAESLLLDVFNLGEVSAFNGSGLFSRGLLHPFSIWMSSGRAAIRGRYERLAWFGRRRRRGTGRLADRQIGKCCMRYDGGKRSKPQF